MRTILLLTVLAVLAAGCATTNPDNGGTPTPGGNTTTGGGTAMAPKEAAKDTHDFATDVTGAPGPKSFNVEPGYTKMTLTVNWTGDAPAVGAGVAQGVTVKVGTLTCAIDGPVTGPSSCTKTGTAVAGSNKIEYSGSGPVTADVKVTLS